jgi:hypothetical protein
MRSGIIPFRFDLSDVLKRASRLTRKHIGSVTLSLPFISVVISPKDGEKRAAREIVVRLKDRRVLSAWECCDNCIDHALKSLQEIRRFLVDKEVELVEFQDGPLYLVIDAMIIGIRQFLTYEQRLKTATVLPARRTKGIRREPDMRQGCFDGLEILRGHLSRCLGQIASIAGMELSANGVIENYQGAWTMEAYDPPTLTNARKAQNAAKIAK